MYISNENLHRIEKVVDSSNITYSHLRDELVDHICCDIETQMDAGADFAQAFQKVRKKFGIADLEKIQETTISLIYLQYNTMKKLMRTTGILAPVIVAFGGLFKIMHWPGAGPALILGVFIAAFLFLPSAVYTLWREQKKSKQILLYISGFIAGFGYVISVLFKIMHWPGAGLLMLLAIVTGGLVFLPLWFTNQYNNMEDRKKIPHLVVGCLVAFGYMFGFLFKMMHWPGAAILLTGSLMVLIFIFLPVYANYLIKNKESVHINFIYSVIAITWFTITSALISINVSTSYFGSIDYAQPKANLQANYYNSLSDNILQKVSVDTAFSQQQINHAKAIKQRSDSLVHSIQNLKFTLIAKANEETKAAIRENENIVMKNVKNKGNTQIPKQLLLDKNSRKASLLKQHIAEYRSFMLKNTSNVDFQKTISQLFHTGKTRKAEWEYKYFCPTSVAGALFTLTMLEQNIRLIEFKAINSLVIQ